MVRLFGTPALFPNEDGRLELFVLAFDGSVHEIWQTTPNGTWSGWHDSGVPSAVEPPALNRSLDQRLEVFAGGGSVRGKWQTSINNGWSSVVNHGSPMVFPGSNAGFGAPTPAFSTRTDCLYVFATDELHGGLWYIRQPSPNNDNFSAWNSLGNPAITQVIGPPGCCENDGLIQVCAVGADGQLWSIQQTQKVQPHSPLEWSLWGSFGKPGVSVADRPAAGAGFDGRNELFIRGTDGSLYHIWQTALLNGWSNWFSHGNPGNPISDHPQIAYPADGRLMVFVSNQDGVHYLRQTAQSNGWSNWVSLGKPAGGEPQSAPAVFGQQNNLLHLFVTAADGSLWNIHQFDADNWSYWYPFGQP